VIAPVSLAVLILALEPWLGKLYPTWVHLFYVVVAGGMLVWAFRNEIKVFQLAKILK
jgi:hypothetical protein